MEQNVRNKIKILLQSLPTKAQEIISSSEAYCVATQFLEQESKDNFPIEECEITLSVCIIYKSKKKGIPCSQDFHINKTISEQ